VGANRANDMPGRADGYGQARGSHLSPRTIPDGAERLTGIYGSEGRVRLPLRHSGCRKLCWASAPAGRAASHGQTVAKPLPDKRLGLP
jgi:hypothetical protein